MKRLLALGLAACLLLAVAACGGSGSDSSSEPTGGNSTSAASSGDETTTLKVGVLPIIDVAPLYVAIEQGYFEEEGLTIEPQVGIGGAAVVPAVMSGDVQVGFSGYTSLIAAQAEGLELAVISGGVAAAEDPARDGEVVVVEGSSGINSPADLEGKRIAVNALKGVVELSTLVSAQKAGVDVEKLNFVEVPIPDEPAALAAGEVDAAVLSEPNLTLALRSGGERLLPVFSAVGRGLDYAGYFTSKQFAESNPGTVEGFRDAMTKAFEYSTENPQAVLKVLSSYTEIPPDQIKDLILPTWPDNNPATLVKAMQVWSEAMVENDFIAESDNDPGALVVGG